MSAGRISARSVLGGRDLALQPYRYSVGGSWLLPKESPTPRDRGLCSTTSCRSASGTDSRAHSAS
jgi:hypothetical protein